MALKNAVVGNGKITQKAVTTRYYTVGESESFFNYQEITITETRIWTALTQQAADNQVGLNIQPNDPKETYTWSAIVDNPILKSYTVQRDYQKTTAIRV